MTANLEVDLMRRVLVGTVAVSVLLIATPQASATRSPESTTVVHFRGRAAEAFLTDCAEGLPVGARCRAVSVFAFEEQVRADGTPLAGPGLSATLFDLTVIADDPGFVSEIVGSGSTSDASVRILPNLSRATAAANVLLDPAGSLAVEVQWTGSGPVSQGREHAVFHYPFGFQNFRSAASDRAAEASGTLDGTPVHDTTVFPSSLHTSRHGFVERFPGVATSPTSAIAAATASSIAHTRESVALARLSDCPLAPTDGTTCLVANVFALVLSGRIDGEAVLERRFTVDLVGITFTPDAPGGFDVSFIGFGVDTAPNVTIDTRLAGASIVASVELFGSPCDDSGCTPVGVSEFSVALTGHGEIMRTRYHTQSAFDGTRRNEVVFAQGRESSARGTIDGSEFGGFDPIPAGGMGTAVVQRMAK